MSIVEFLVNFDFKKLWRRKKKTVLIVEDNTSTIELILIATKENKLEAQVAHSAEEAEGILQANGKKFVLVMIDIGLPYTDGWKLRLKIKELWSNVKICMMSANSERLSQLIPGDVTMVLMKSSSYIQFFRDLKSILI